MGKSLSESAAEILNATIGKNQEPAKKMSTQADDLGGAVTSQPDGGEVGKKAAAARAVAPKPGQASTPGDKAGAPKNAGTSKMFNQPAASAGFGDSVEHDGETVIAEEEDLTEEEIEEYLNSLTEEELEALVSESSEEDLTEEEIEEYVNSLTEEEIEEYVNSLTEEELEQMDEASLKQKIKTTLRKINPEMPFKMFDRYAKHSKAADAEFDNTMRLHDKVLASHGAEMDRATDDYKKGWNRYEKQRKYAGRFLKLSSGRPPFREEVEQMPEEELEQIDEVKLTTAVKALRGAALWARPVGTENNLMTGKPVYDATPRERARVSRFQAAIGRKFGEKGARAAHMAVTGHERDVENSNDPLKTKQKKSLPQTTLTKGPRKGKLDAGHQKYLKQATINSILASREMKKPNLPEEVEQMSEEEIAEARKAAMKKMVSDKMSSCKEDVDALFNGESLSEEFRTKATTIFEAAVRARVETVTEEIFAENEKILTDTVASLQEEMSTQVDEYLNYVVEGWLEDNQLAVETGLRAEIAEDFMAGLKNLFAEHYIEVPQEKADLVEEMAAKVVEAEEALAEQAEQFAALTEALNESKSKEILRKICEGLTEVQVEKIKALAEGVKFTTEGEYTDKLAVIRENYFPSKSVKREAPQTVVETEEARDVSGVMDHYVKAISKTLPK